MRLPSGSYLNVSLSADGNVVFVTRLKSVYAASTLLTRKREIDSSFLNILANRAFANAFAKPGANNVNPKLRLPQIERVGV